MLNQTLRASRPRWPFGPRRPVLVNDPGRRFRKRRGRRRAPHSSHRWFGSDRPQQGDGPVTSETRNRTLRRPGVVRAIARVVLLLPLEHARQCRGHHRRCGAPAHQRHRVRRRLHDRVDDPRQAASGSRRSDARRSLHQLAADGDRQGNDQQRHRFRRLHYHGQFLQLEPYRDDRLHDSESDRQRDQDRHGNQRDVVLYRAGPHVLHGAIGYNNIAISGTSTSSYKLPTYIDFYLMIDVSGSMSFPSTASEQARLQAVNPDNMTGSNGYPKGCTFACHFAAQGAAAIGKSRSGTLPRRRHLDEFIAGGYCQGFIITRLGTTPVSFASGNNSTNGSKVNWTNSQVGSCPIRARRLASSCAPTPSAMP